MIENFTTKHNQKWITKHIKGHQSQEYLTREAELDNVANKFATQAREQILCNNRYQEPPVYSTSKVPFMIENSVIIQQTGKKIQEHTEGDLNQYMEINSNGDPTKWI